MNRKTAALYAECPNCGYKNWKLEENDNDFVGCYDCGADLYSEDFIAYHTICDINKTQLLCLPWDDIKYLLNLGVHVHSSLRSAPIRGINNIHVTFHKLNILQDSYEQSVLDEVYVGGKHNNLLTEQTFLNIQ